MAHDAGIRIGYIGAGNIGNVHMQQFSRFPDLCSAAAVCDFYPPAARERAAQYGIPDVAESAEELIHRADVERSSSACRISFMGNTPLWR